MAVRHFVCVFVGAPGPVQGAATAMPGTPSDTNPNTAGASTLVKGAIKLDVIEMNLCCRFFSFILESPSSSC